MLELILLLFPPDFPLTFFNLHLSLLCDRKTIVKNAPSMSSFSLFPFPFVACQSFKKALDPLPNFHQQNAIMAQFSIAPPHSSVLSSPPIPLLILLSHSPMGILTNKKVTKSLFSLINDDE
jgi:hypothetical protein